MCRDLNVRYLTGYCICWILSQQMWSSIKNNMIKMYFCHFTKLGAKHILFYLSLKEGCFVIGLRLFFFWKIIYCIKLFTFIYDVPISLSLSFIHRLSLTLSHTHSLSLSHTHTHSLSLSSRFVCHRDYKK